ncbi:class A sortase [Vagococcus proximus]|nr:class A sortase [Vagococcus proximus]
MFYSAVILIGSPFLKSTLINYRSISYSYIVNDELPKVIPKVEEIAPPTFEEAIKIEEPNSEGIIGAVTLDKVGIDLPVFVGVTNQNLLFGTAILYPERDPLIDNIVILGHHLGYQGKLLSPLLSVEEGNDIELLYLGDRYKYKVTSAAIVKETNLSVLDNTIDDKGVLTLITCDKPTETDQRFVVKAKLMSTTNKDVSNLQDTTIKQESSSQISQNIVKKKEIDWHLYLPLIIIIGLLIVVTPILIRLSK